MERRDFVAWICGSGAADSLVKSDERGAIPEDS
jgi:hypothetical protein